MKVVAFYIAAPAARLGSLRAKARVLFAGRMYGLKPVPFRLRSKEGEFSFPMYDSVCSCQLKLT